MPNIDPQIINFLSHPLVIFAITTWSLVWKGFALWNSTKNNQLNWFIALLILNTVGILDIIYLKFFKKREKEVDSRIWEIVRRSLRIT